MKYSFNLGLSRDDWVNATSNASLTKRNLNLFIVWSHLPLWRCSPSFTGLLGVCLTTKHKPFCQTNGSCVGESGRPQPKLQRWALFDSCFHLVIIPPSHSRNFGLPKVFLSLFPSIPPLLLSFCHWAVIGCYDSAVLALSASSKAQFNYSFSLT